MIFPQLVLENLVQAKDKTRLDASLSYVSDGDPIVVYSVKPGKLASPIDVSVDKFLDYQFDFVLDVDALNNTITVDEGAGPFDVVIPDDSYTLSELAIEIQAKLNTDGGLTYTAEVSSDDKITISADAAFKLVVGDESLLPEIGFASDQTGKATYTGESIDQVKKEITLTVSTVVEEDPEEDPEDPEEDESETTISQTLMIVSERADHLFSNDGKLKKHRNDIVKYLPEGRASFKDVHRRAQELMLAWMDTQGFIDDLGYKFTLKRIKDINEVTEWATFMTLKLIMLDNSNAIDDIFSKDAKAFESLENFYRDRAVLRIDMNEDGKIDFTEELDTRSCFVVRR